MPPIRTIFYAALKVAFGLIVVGSFVIGIATIALVSIENMIDHRFHVRHGGYVSGISTDYGNPPAMLVLPSNPDVGLTESDADRYIKLAQNTTGGLSLFFPQDIIFLTKPLVVERPDDDHPLQIHGLHVEADETYINVTDFR